LNRLVHIHTQKKTTKPTIWERCKGYITIVTTLSLLLQKNIIYRSQQIPNSNSPWVAENTTKNRKVLKRKKDNKQFCIH
jgi:hypothetical protein